MFQTKRRMLDATWSTSTYLFVSAETELESFLRKTETASKPRSHSHTRQASPPCRHKPCEASHPLGSQKALPPILLSKIRWMICLSGATQKDILVSAQKTHLKFLCCPVL